MKYLLDTDICIHWLRGNLSIRERLGAAGSENVAVSVITLAELRYGADCSNQPERNHQAIDNFTSAIHVLGIDGGIASKFGEIKANLRREGNLIEDFDLLIAATADVHGLALVTGNLGHFRRISDLQIEDWT